MSDERDTRRNRLKATNGTLLAKATRVGASVVRCGSGVLVHYRRATKSMSQVTDLSGIVFLVSVFGALAMAIFGVLFRSRYEFLPDFEGDWMQTARVCFRTSLAFLITAGVALFGYGVGSLLDRRRRARSLSSRQRKAYTAL